MPQFIAEARGLLPVFAINSSKYVVVKKAADGLVKEGKILYKKTTGEEHVSLNPVYAKEIKEEAVFSKKE